MSLKIHTTGIEQYLPGGEANLKVMMIGGPGAGKTRWSSYFPDPIYADAEAGLSSVADRQVPFATIRSSKDMLDFLVYLKQECMRPKEQRKYKTAVIDTLDAFQRKVKDEWLQANPTAASFSGYDAWGYLDAKMQMLMTRLLNLDMNVIVNVHFKDKVTTEGQGSSRTEVHQLMLQLQGDIKDSAFNDFDLVGWMGTYWVAEGDPPERVQKRGITFKPTPDKPFLKDRLHVTPEWMEVTFDTSDYVNLFNAFLSRVDELAASKEVGEIPDAGQYGEAPVKGTGVVGPVSGGPVAPQDPREAPLDQLKKPELIQLARSYPAIRDQVKANLLKSELIEMIEKARAAGPTPEEESNDPGVRVEDYDSSKEVKQPAQQVPEAPPTAVEAPLEGSAASTPVQPGIATSADGTKQADPATGEILTPEQVAERLDATVISDEKPADEPKTETPPSPQAPPSAKVCVECGKDLASENQDYVRLGYIKFRKLLCNVHYLEAKKAQ